MIIQQLISLFAEMDVATATCLILGLILAVAEIFQPGFKIYGALGGILLIAGVFLRITEEEGDGAFAMFFILVFIIALILFCSFFIMVKTVRHGWLMNTRGKEETNSGAKRGQSDVDYSFLIGKLGVASTMLRPSGKVEIDDAIYAVSADGFFISRGEVVRVIGVDGNGITVRRADI